ncbi:hypothetical protein MCY_01263 [Bartonella rattimassiliensis 15908]|uniref:Uncharacterized protein n=1 Tax=Bartonella rattimassiliensis 15908 TaxID=1094556 RepID=J0QL46_9HYPH|nr:hypothetical protein MCY_01263 [Bartonella rattimassiliensis 15908]
MALINRLNVRTLTTLGAENVMIVPACSSTSIT